MSFVSQLQRQPKETVSCLGPAECRVWGDLAVGLRFVLADSHHLRAADVKPGSERTADGSNLEANGNKAGEEILDA
jgi:hypothetical protein